MKYYLMIICIPGLTACIPRIEVAPPKEPVTINMNVKIDHEISINMDQQLKTILEQNSDLLTPQPDSKAGHSAQETKPTH